MLNKNTTKNMLQTNLWYILLHFAGTDGMQMCYAAQVTSVTCIYQETQQRRAKYSFKITLPTKQQKKGESMLHTPCRKLCFLQSGIRYCYILW